MFVVINDDTYESVNSEDVMRVEPAGESNEGSLIYFHTAGESVLSPFTAKKMFGILTAVK